jgi:hypothetical protein
MSKITQARARADRRKLKELQVKMYRYMTHTSPGVFLRSIEITPDAKLVIETARKLGSDVLYRFNGAHIQAYAVRGP